MQLTPAPPAPAVSQPVPQAPDYLGSWNWRGPARAETVQDWAARIDRQEAEIKRRAAAWLREGRKVRVIHDPSPVGQSLTNSIGVIHKRCPPCFSDHAYVRFDAPDGDAAGHIQMLGLERLAPCDYEPVAATACPARRKPRRRF